MPQKNVFGNLVDYEEAKRRRHKVPPPFGGGWGEASASRLLRPLFVGHRGMADGKWRTSYHLLL